jgi:hypothetical protein
MSLNPMALEPGVTHLAPVLPVLPVARMVDHWVLVMQNQKEWVQVAVLGWQ